MHHTVLKSKLDLDNWQRYLALLRVTVRSNHWFSHTYIYCYTCLHTRLNNILTRYCQSYQFGLRWDYSSLLVSMYPSWKYALKYHSLKAKIGNIWYIWRGMVGMAWWNNIQRIFGYLYCILLCMCVSVLVLLMHVHIVPPLSLTLVRWKHIGLWQAKFSLVYFVILIIVNCLGLSPLLL